MRLMWISSRLGWAEHRFIVAALEPDQPTSTAYAHPSTPRFTAIVVQQQDSVVVLTSRLHERLSISAQHARAAALAQLRGVLVAQVHCARWSVNSFLWQIKHICSLPHIKLRTC